MTQQHGDSTIRSGPTGRRPWRRWISLVTLVAAAGYFCGARVALNGLGSWVGVRPLNSTRILLQLMTLPSQSDATPAPAPTRGFIPFLGRPAPAVAPEVLEQQRKTQREIAAVEAVAHAWERLMWGFSAFLVLMALLSWLTSWKRLWHLLSAGAVFLVTLVTLAGVRYLDIPDGSDYSIWPLSPPAYHSLLKNEILLRGPGRSPLLEARWDLPTGGGLPAATRIPLWFYLAFGTVLSAYGWVLLFTFARRSRPPQTPAPEANDEA